MRISQDKLDKLSLGNEEIFHDIFTEFYPKVKSFARGFLKDADEAEDIAQTVFINLWLHRERLATVADLDAYLYVSTRNRVLNVIASAKAPHLSLDETEYRMAGADNPQDDLAAHDQRLLIDLIVANMPKQRQTVFRMSRVEGLPNEEIARRLGIRQKTVENHLNLALREIRKGIVLAYLLLTAWG